jgi:hypothetical protein
MKTYLIPNNQDSFKITTEDKHVSGPNAAIFPILRKASDGKLHLIGTGFFITSYGVFATAKHVADEINGIHWRADDQLTILHFYSEKDFHVRKIKHITCHEKADVAVGACEFAVERKTGNFVKNKILKVSNYQGEIGAQVFTYAYPHTVIENTPEQIITLQPKFYEGAINDFLPQGRDKTFLPMPCYQTSIAVHGGASGGPVFTSNKGVFGINSTGYTGQEDISFISQVKDIFDLSICDDEGKQLLIRDSITFD